MEPNTHVVIVAAGSGTRFGKDLPKQFALLNKLPVLTYSINTFRKVLPKDSISLVLSVEMIDYWKDLCKSINFISPDIVKGGKTRWESVKNGILSLKEINKEDIILVHDGARPLVTIDIVKGIIDAIKEGHLGAIPVIDVVDSIREIDNDSSRNLDRSKLRAVQTPQGFRAYQLLDAFKQPYSEVFTDEASVMESAGYKDILLTKGDSRNIKITRPIDLKIAEFYLSNERS